MASLSYNEKHNRWVIQFLAPAGRKSLSMKASVRARDKGQSKAAAFKNHIEELTTAVKSGTSIPPQVATWLDNLPADTHTKLVDAGLVGQRLDPELSKLGPFLDKWFADRAGTKRSTELTWRHVERNLRAYFGSDKPLTQITQDDAENFERWLKSAEKLSDATRRKRVSIAKQMLTSARKARLIAENPFSEMKTAAVTNKSRQYFVSDEETRKVLDACSDAEWRAMVALARYGALRIPSEIRELKWSDINWENSCFHVHAPKNEHHEDEGDRVVPLFPEVRKVLDDLWERPEAEGEVYVLPRLRHTTNVLPTLTRIIKRAGLKVWPKGWQNMRATRATELENEFGAHKATQWCGHSEKIAEAFYWMVTDDDVSKASEFASDESRAAHALQKGAEEAGNGQPKVSKTSVNSRVFASLPSPSVVSNGGRGTRSRQQSFVAHS